MSGGGRPPHGVLLRAPARFDAKAAAAVLASRMGIPAETLLPMMRRNWGWIAEPSDAEGAEALAAALCAAGQPAVAVPASLVEEPPPPALVSKTELGPEGFDVLAGKGGAAPERLPWKGLAVLAAGAVVERALKTKTEAPSPAARAVGLGLTLATGLPLLRRREKVVSVEEERRTLFVDLLFTEPLRRLRIIAAEFDYSALGAKMGYSAELNFRALVAELATPAPEALRSKGVRAILAKAPAIGHIYESFEDAGREQRWLLALATLGAALAG